MVFTSTTATGGARRGSRAVDPQIQVEAANWSPAGQLDWWVRKIIKNRGHFPNDEAVIKLLWLAICTIEDKRARARAKEAGLGRGAKRKAEGHLVEGQTTTSWKQALAQLALAYPDRINPYL